MATRKAKKTQGVHTIPEIRRTFEYMEEYVAKKIASRHTMSQIAKDLQTEWKKKFGKPLDERSAHAFVEDMRTKPRPHVTKEKRTIRHRGGALHGAPLTDTMRAGIALAPASIPMGGHLPLSGGAPSTFGSFVDYISGGFRVPEPSGNITGKFGWPQPYSTTGSNAAGSNAAGSNAAGFRMTGGRRTPRNRHHKKRTVRGGGRLADALSSFSPFSSPLVSQFAMRPIPSQPVPSTLQNIQSTWKGQTS